MLWGLSVLELVVEPKIADFGNYYIHVVLTVRQTEVKFEQNMTQSRLVIICYEV